MRNVHFVTALGDQNIAPVHCISLHVRNKMQAIKTDFKVMHPYVVGNKIANLIRK